MSYPAGASRSKPENRKERARSTRPRLGQHFLASPAVLSRVASAIGAAASRCDLIVEIGAGTGNLTARLVELGLPVVAIEIDPALAETLRSKFPKSSFEAIGADILDIDLRQLIESRGARSALIAGNLPYYITSPILQNIFRAGPGAAEAVLMMQKEVAERVTARPGSRDFGYLSVLCQAHSRPQKLFTIAPGAFRPPPKVTSAAVRLHIEPRFEEWGVSDAAAFLDFARLCFHQKRKTLVNNLEGRFGRARVLALAEAHLRAEQLAPERLAAIFISLAGKSRGG